LPVHRRHQRATVACNAAASSGALICMRFGLPLLAISLFFITAARAQLAPAPESRYYAPLNSVAALFEYSNSSSHIVLGEDRQRKFAGLALAYQRRISASHGMSWAYSAEVRPILVESDPTLREAHFTTNLSGPITKQDFYFVHQLPVENLRLYPDIYISGTIGGRDVYFQTSFNRGRRWTYAPGITPACFSVHFLPSRQLQPFLASTGGFVISPRDIPEFRTSAFNFTFSFGGGVEWFRDRTRSWIVEYRVQHMSNKKIGMLNPGVDSQFLRVGYRFGF
jgi:Lipid A 3-O-deacylase (PagL)